MSEITDKWRKLRQEMGNLICEVDGKTEKLEAEESDRTEGLLSIATKIKPYRDFYKLKIDLPRI